MARPITKIHKPAPTEQEKQSKALENVVQEVAENADGLRETMKLLQELHDSGILKALNALVEAKEDVAKIAVDLLRRDQTTNAINNVMAIFSVFSQLDPTVIEKLMNSVKAGLDKAEDSMHSQAELGVFDLIKALKDPDINRALVFILNLLKGVGAGLKEGK
ncbi:DUF1641 domain-containing protein [Thermoflavimicrobium daqui]|jgi:uncharacterized protein YjgD (DUF1641 family)|uniref:DUF1641 domain-containing protein n=1 Tax=Thermoflavimicrobium daqui TaxID=2137476 RepID=A0A364K4W0_9BACL|nr:DUF1641 domain-containing protein [Thermoflavimicrobium daqui]RAL24410.1 hypothetical protein DL897_08780 [Thermoflavimicrobium daqui]